MQIDLNSQEHEIVKLLAGLKNTNSAYPPKLLASRRLNFLKRVAEIGMGADVKNIHKEKKQAFQVNIHRIA